MNTQQLGPAVLDVLNSNIEGDVVLPGQANYDEARKVWNGMIDRRPALIVRCRGTADVVTAVDFARANALAVAVRGGAHSAQGYGTCEGGIVIDVSPMKRITVDPDAGTAVADAGLTWGEFDAATQEHGLAVTGGRFSTTGIAGLTLGSGSGWLERKCGLTSDNLLSAEVVTADGSVVSCSEAENTDLFRALRGGGGNFGIVTSFEFRLHRVGPVIYGGMLVCDPERGPALLRFMREYMPGAPDDLGAAVAFVSAPPEPFVPEEMHGAPVVGVVICWTGSMDDAEAVIGPIREVAQPLMDLVEPMPYVALQSMLDGGGPHGIRGYMKAEFMQELSDEAIDVLVEHGAKRPGPMVQLLMEPMGGAISRMDTSRTSLARRDVPWCYHALGMWMEPGEEAERSHVAWTKELAAALEPHTTRGVYLNFTSDEGSERVRDAYGDRYDELVAVKDKYDPTNMFRLNQNIKPSAEALARAERPE